MTDDTTSASAQAELPPMPAPLRRYLGAGQIQVLGYSADQMHAYARAAIAASAPTGQGAGLTDAEIEKAAFAIWGPQSKRLPMAAAHHFARAIESALATRSAGDGQAVLYRFKDARGEWIYTEDADVRVSGLQPLYLAPPPAASVRDAQDAALWRKWVEYLGRVKRQPFDLAMDVSNWLDDKRKGGKAS